MQQAGLLHPESVSHIVYLQNRHDSEFENENSIEKEQQYGD